MINFLESKTMTVVDYLAMERAAETKNEYINGEVRPMTGASRRHNLILGNIYAFLHAQLRQSTCEIYPSALRVKVEAANLYTYPDISAVCATPTFDDVYKDTLLNPCLIIEVLSPSTAAYDRGEKFENYRQIQSLQDYLLVAQDKMHIEYYTRQSDNTWVFVEFKHADDSFTLASIQCVLLLQEVYAKVILDQSSTLGGHA